MPTSQVPFLLMAVFETSTFSVAIIVVMILTITFACTYIIYSYDRSLLTKSLMSYWAAFKSSLLIRSLQELTRASQRFTKYSLVSWPSSETSFSETNIDVPISLLFDVLWSQLPSDVHNRINNIRQEVASQQGTTLMLVLMSA